MLISVYSNSSRFWKTFCNSTKSHQAYCEKTRCYCPSSVRNRKDCHFFHCLTPIYWHNSSWNPSFVPLTDQRIGNTNSKGKDKIAKSHLLEELIWNSLWNFSMQNSFAICFSDKIWAGEVGKWSRVLLINERKYNQPHILHFPLAIFQLLRSEFS